jgi:type II secretory pathway pseudopilin PulG
MIRIGKTRRIAFTLVEVVVALAIASVVLVIVLGVAADTLTMQRSAAAFDDGTSASLSALDLIQRDFLCLSRAPDGKGQFVAQKNGQGIELEFLTTFAVAPSAAPGARYEFQLRVLRYTTRAEKDGALTLLRSSRGWADGSSLKEPPAIPVARGLSKVEAEYYDGALWRDRWQEQKPPAAMRVRLTRAGAPTSHVQRTVQPLWIASAGRGAP